MQRKVAIALTVRALLRRPPLSDAEVVAGEAGLDNEVSWPAMLRVRPPAFEPMSGHELAVVSTEALRLLDESLTLGQLLGRLAERAVAGVVVIGGIDAAAIERAEQANLPLLHLAESYHLSDLGPSLSRVIAEERTRLYQLGLDVQHQLTDVSMEGRGLRGILGRLADLSGREVVLQNAVGDVIARAVTAERADSGESKGVVPAIELLRGYVGDRFDNRTEPPVVRVTLPGAEGLVAPVVVRDLLVGYLTMLGSGESITDDDGVILARGSVVCALEMAKQEAVTEAEYRLRGDFFEDLLGTGVSSPESLISRARHLGYDLQQPYAVLAIRFEHFEPGGSRLAAGEGLLREVTNFLTARHNQGWLAPRDEAVALFLVVESPGDVAAVHRFAEELRDYIAQRAGFPTSIGVGSLHPGVLGLRTSYHEAEQASRIGREFFGPGQVTSYGDLGVYRLLYAFRRSRELSEFCRETLAPLVDYDQKNGTALIETLDVYFRCDASLRVAADALYLHRNSLAYRLRRIAELTQLDLDNLEDRFRLQLALKAYRLVRTEGADNPSSPIARESSGRSPQ
ncbi:MAG TPA: helix-turn-helix domain-containing protein [Chloroflexota bacterium]|nr:helix-turn-helix domain-containing protein [Chloroflexota bacterium]